MAAAVIFFLTYLVLAVGRLPPWRVDRTGAAIIGAILMVAVGEIGLEGAYRAIDYRTIVLLFGMMVVIAHLRLATFFRVLARTIVRRIHHPLALLVAIVFASGVLSALFVNDTICLVFTPVLIEVARARGHRPLPYLLALATSANIGSVATITGNPQNMLIGSLSAIGYVAFLGALAPVALVGLAIDVAIIWWLFRDELHRTPLDDADVRPPRPVHRAMMAKGLVVAGLVLAGFLAGYDPALVASGGAAALLVTRRVNPDKVYRQIDWDLLVLFIGLFVVVAGVSHAGLDRRFFEALTPVGIDRVWGISAVAAILSNLISNVPAVMLFTKLVPHLPDPQASWLALAMSSTLAGNLTLLGSIANLIVLEGAKRQGVEISFGDYLRVGVPVTLLTLGFGVWWLS